MCEKAPRKVLGWASAAVQQHVGPLPLRHVRSSEGFQAAPRALVEPGSPLLSERPLNMRSDITRRVQEHNSGLQASAPEPDKYWGYRRAANPFSDGTGKPL